MTNKFIQFELWKECSQGCKFCCNKGQEPINKTESCKYVLEKLNELKIGEYDSIGLIGGEFFDGELESHLEDFCFILQRIADLRPKTIYIATHLIYDMRKYLIPILEYCDKGLKILDKLVLCTSWDTKYRFHTIEQQTLWSRNMLRLQRLFPKVKLHVEMILTQDLIDSVNHNLLNLTLFKDIFKCSVDFIEPSSGLYYKDKWECKEDMPDFFPTRSSFIQFLQKVKHTVDLDTLLSMELRSEELYFIENGKRRVAKNRRETDGRCELSDKTKKYDIGFIDTDEPMRAVVEQFIELTR